MPTSLAPVVDDGTRVLILGSMPGEISLRMQQYYAHPRNIFWRIMSDVLDIDATAEYALRLAALRSAGIGLWDVLHICDRLGSLDSAIVRDSMEANDFRSLLRQYTSISRVYFNGAKAEQVFLRMVSPETDVPLSRSRLPSTSPANAAVPYETKLDAWRALLDIG